MEVPGRPPMADRRRRPGLLSRWLTIRVAAQYRGHSPSWLRPECLTRRQEIGLPVIGRLEDELTNNWSDQDREQREQRNGPEHRQ